MAPLLRWQSAAPAGSDPEGNAQRRPHAGLLRRERRDLLDAREELLRKLGGLMVEMYRRNDYRDELLAEICAEVLGIDERLGEIETLLDSRRQRQTCVCGAPLLAGARYCPNCGRDVSNAPAASEPAHPRGT